MWDWLSELMEIINRYGFPLVATGIFLIILPLAVSKLWREYRDLMKRNNEILVETVRLMETASFESEIAAQTIETTLRRLHNMRKILTDISLTLSEMQKKAPDEPGR